MRLRSPFWCHHSKKPVQGFEQGLNKVSSFQAAHAYLCHFQSAFCPTLPTPPMPGASKWGQILCSKALLLVLLQGICARRESNPGHKHGSCMLPLHHRRHDTSQETRQWLLAIAPPPFLLCLSQTTQRCSQTSDSEGIQTPAGRAQWISGPSPWPLGHTVMLVPVYHIQHKVYTPRPHGHLSQHLRAHCQSSPSCAASKHICMTKCICISRESNPGHIDGDDVFCH